MNSLTIVKLYCKTERKREIQRNNKILSEISNILKEKCFFDFELEILHENCFYVFLNKALSLDEFIKFNYTKLNWLLSHDIFAKNTLQRIPAFVEDDQSLFIEVGPRPSMITPFSTNAVSACHSASMHEIKRIEQSRRYKILVKFNQKEAFSLDRQKFIRNHFKIFGDEMTECHYENSDSVFTLETLKMHKRKDYKIIDLIGSDGKINLDKANTELGLGFDEEDLKFYLEFFRDRIQRNPTDVELFGKFVVFKWIANLDMAQSNSEHSRHWFFKGEIIVDGFKRSKCLFDSIRDTQLYSNPNNVISFSDNSSALEGFTVQNLVSENPTKASRLITKNSLRHILYTAETHNFPTAVCPFAGSATGVGGRIRDVHATGRGAHEIAGVAGYSVGNLKLPGYSQPWEDRDSIYPSSFASSLKVLLDASDGASDYGNKFGEPLILGFTRTFGMNIPIRDSKTERIEYVKPIMFSGGIGSIDGDLIHKAKCSPGQIVAKIGGPVYRIGVGGGAASSLTVQGDRESSIDFGAVQRGDPEMEHKLHRVIRACVESGAEKNPIFSIHDQGAGGNGENGGAKIHADKFELGDPTISILELWTAEYQESNAILLDPKQSTRMQKICERERCKLSSVGEVSGDGKVVLTDYVDKNNNKQPPVDLVLDQIAERKPKCFEFDKPNEISQTLDLVYPKNTHSKIIGVKDALELVLRLPTVSSKRFLTQKVDRSVTGLIAQQQCCGPLHTPLADVAVTALSYWETVGSAISVGEQPIKGLIKPEMGARMSIGEAGNWMWAAKIENEGARLVAACDSMCELMKELGIAIDGGKDSLSMAAKVTTSDGHLSNIVKAPGTLVISAYAPCTDITKVITPDFKTNSKYTNILYMKMTSYSSFRLGGSALAQCLGQIGGTANLKDGCNQFSLCPDLDDAVYFKKCFKLFQQWVKNEWILSGHDVSDGGLLTALLESAFAGNCSIECDFGVFKDEIEQLSFMFGEELGLIFEVEDELVEKILSEANSIALKQIGKCHSSYGPDAKIILDEPLNSVREIWEETSDRLDQFHITEQCLKELSDWRKTVKFIDYKANFEYKNFTIPQNKFTKIPKVAILREEGSNGDREMAAAFMMAGFETYDLTMSDILNWATDSFATSDLLSAYDGLAFVGGFSYADVLGSAKGWAASIRFNERVQKLFQHFKSRTNTFTLGVCNGCQLSTLLGFVGGNFNGVEEVSEPQIFLDENDCGRFYSGFNTVRITASKSIFFDGMDGSVLGVWCSHGEGLMFLLQYCDSNGCPTKKYPENPNGSIEAVAAICSSDGRHLAIMPHPERSFLEWQWPDKCMNQNKPKDFKCHHKQFSPWIRIFQNAFEWASKQSLNES